MKLIETRHCTLVYADGRVETRADIDPGAMSVIGLPDARGYRNFFRRVETGAHRKEGASVRLHRVYVEFEPNRRDGAMWRRG